MSTTSLIALVATAQAQAISVTNGSTVAVPGPLFPATTYTTSAPLGPGTGISATNSSTVNATGVTITTSGDQASGIGARTGATIDYTGGSITTLATTGTGTSSSYGAFANGGTAGIALHGTSISTAGISAYGVYGISSNRVLVDATTVLTSGAAANGIQATSGAVITVQNGSRIETTGAGANGIASLAGSTINVSDTGIITRGANAVGMVSSANASSLARIAARNVTVETFGDGSVGAEAFQLGSTLTFDGGSVTTHGIGAAGVSAQDNATLSATGVTISTAGQNAAGAFAFASGAVPGVVNLTNGSVTTSGPQAVGLRAQGNGIINANGTPVTTSGASGHGLEATQGGTINFANQTVTTTGASAAGLNFGPTPVGVVNTIKVTNATVNPAGDGLRAITGVNVATLTGSTLNAGSGIALDSVSQASTTFTADASTINGSAQTASSAVMNVTLQNNSLWNMTGTSTVTTLVNNASLIGYSPPTGDRAQLTSYKTLTTNSYVGIGGRIGLNTYLGTDGAASDRLVINGGTATGDTTLIIRNTAGPGALTLSDGIKVVDAINGATTANGSFALQGEFVTADGQQAVVGGAFAYTLHHNGVVDPADSDWYLRSSLRPVPPTPPGPTPPDPTPPNPPVPPQPRYQPGVPLYEVYPQHLLALNTVPTLQQRVGNRYWTEPAPETVFCKDASQNFQCPVTGEQAQYYAGADGHQALIEDQRAIWGRIEGSHASIEPAVSNSGTDYDTNVWRLQAGLDGLLHQAEDGSKLIGGITVHFGQASSNVTSFFGDGDINTNGYGFGGTLTWYDQNGFYVDGQAQLTWFNSDLTSKARDLETPTLVDGNGGFGYALSLETGKKIDLNETWTLTPQAQLVYANVDFSSFTDVFGSNISLGSGDSLLGRLGISADHDQNWKDDEGKTRRRHLYGIANLYYQFLDATRVDVSGVSFESRPDRAWTWRRLQLERRQVRSLWRGLGQQFAGKLRRQLRPCRYRRLQGEVVGKEKGLPGGGCGRPHARGCA